MNSPAYYGHCPAPGCGAEIAWTVNVYSGRLMPVDWVPAGTGNVAVRVVGDRLVSRGLCPGDSLCGDEHAAMPHSLTCHSQVATS
jgi:hypothetical protein